MYKDIIKNLIESSGLEIDLDVKIEGRPPSAASSEFLTNKEQGDWAEKVAHKAINDSVEEYFSVNYGVSANLSAGDEGFSEFYLSYQNELNTIGKKPDLLIFKKRDFPDKIVNLNDDEQIKKAVAAIEVRSSAFMINQYSSFMNSRKNDAIVNCSRVKTEILNSRLGELLETKKKDIFDMISSANENTFKNIKFRLPAWSSSDELIQLKEKLKEFKNSLNILQKRDFLSITPKMEDIALVNRWVQHYNIRHYYLQVFFDTGYLISFQKILELVNDDSNKGKYYSIERDVKNQGKTTIKVNVAVAGQLLSKIDMPEHISAMKELARGRLLFYVTFKEGIGHLNKDIFNSILINE